MRYFRAIDDESVVAVVDESEADDYACDDSYVELTKSEFDDLIADDPWRA